MSQDRGVGWRGFTTGAAGTLAAPALLSLSRHGFAQAQSAALGGAGIPALPPPP